MIGRGLEVGLTTLGQPRLSEGAQPYPLQRVSAQGGTGDRMIGWGHTLSGFGSRPAGIRYGLSGLGSDPGPAPEPEDLNQGPEGRDLGPEMPLAWPTGQLINRSTSVSWSGPGPSPSPGPYSVSLLHLCTVSLCSTKPLSLRASHVPPCPLTAPPRLPPLPTRQLVNRPAIDVWPTGQLINQSTSLSALSARTLHSPPAETPDESHSGRNSSDRCAG